MGGKEQKFKTKTGYCHILPDKIVLTRTGVIGDLSEIVVKESSSRILIIYGIIAVGLLCFALMNYLTNHNLTAFIFCGFGLLLINGIVKSLNFSGTPLVHRSDIQQVVFKKGIFGITKSRFEVLFKNENGKIRKRIIMLPGSLMASKESIQQAVQIMLDTGVLPETNVGNTQK